MNDFEIFMRGQQLSENTIYAYLGALNAFEAWFIGKSGLPFEAGRIKPEDFNEYTDHMRDKSMLDPSTINKNLAALRKWLQMQRESGSWTQDIDIPDVKQQKKKPALKWLEPQEIAAILYAIEQEKNEFLRARDRCMSYFELYRGIRIGENMTLLMADVITTPGMQKIILRSGKDDYFDEIDISKSRKLLNAVQEWIDIRSQSKFASSPHFFISFRSGKVTIGAVNKMVDRIRERSHIHYTTHQLRHTFIHDFERESDLRTAHEAARLSTTEQAAFYTMPSDKNIAEVYRRIEENY